MSAREMSARETPRARTGPRGYEVRPARPPLRWPHVLWRGFLYGLAGIPVVLVTALSIGGHDARFTFLSVVGGFGLITCPVALLVGAFWWWCGGGDVERWRDLGKRSTTTDRIPRADPLAPTFLRIGALCVPLAPAAALLAVSVQNADTFSFWHGR